MTYANLPENKLIKNKIKNKIVWISDLSEVDLEIGIYFFRDKITKEIVYIGQGGAIGQNLKKRISQYFEPGDSGSETFKLKVRNYPEGFNKVKKKEYYKENYQDAWREYMVETFQVGLLRIDEVAEHDVKIEESYLIGLFRTEYNY